MSNDKEPKSSHSEISAFRELKSRVVEEFGPNVTDDRKITRFLRARDYNVKQAYAMIKNDLEWRKQHSIDTLVQDYEEIELLSKYLAMNVIGFDKENSAIIFSDFGNADTRGLLKSTKKEELVLHIAYLYELAGKQLQEQSEKTGVFVDTWILIGDMKDLSYYQLSSKAIIEYLIEASQLSDLHHPEKLKSAYIINSSATFMLLYGIIKPFLALKTQKKINVYGKDGWKEDLLKVIDPEVLPAYLGGKRTDPDGNPMCNTIICHGGPVPEKYFMANTRKSLKNQPSVRSHLLKRRSQLKVPLYVQKEGSYIEWEFETEDHDLGFGLFYRDFDSEEGDELLPIIPVQRFDSYLQCETGTLKCEEPGIYIFTLDNSYSRLRSKKVHYKVSVVKPNDNKEDISK